MRDCSGLDATYAFGQLFTLWPLISVLTALFICIPCENEFFRMFMGNYWEINREGENFRQSRFAIIEAKGFLHCSALQIKLFFQFPPGVIKKHAKKKKVYCWLKNKEPGERKVKFWALILMFIFHEKCQSLGHVKMQNFSLQHANIFGVLASPWTMLKTQKRKRKFRFHGKWIVSLTSRWTKNDFKPVVFMLPDATVGFFFFQGNSPDAQLLQVMFINYLRKKNNRHHQFCHTSGQNWSLLFTFNFQSCCFFFFPVVWIEIKTFI